MSDLDLMSCAAEQLYGASFPFEDDTVYLDLLGNQNLYGHHIEVITEIFPSAGPIERDSSDIICSDNSYVEAIRQHNKTARQHFNYIPASLLVKIKKAIVWNSMVFVDIGDRVIPIYEFYRPSDRKEKKTHLLGRLAACRDRENFILPGENLIFAGSAGSFNYGHWLADDFPTLAGATYLSDQGLQTRVLMSGYSEGINEARLGSVDFAYQYRHHREPLFLNINRAYYIDDLFYVTPCTYHPYLKNPHAIDSVRALCREVFFDTDIEGGGNKIFVNRDIDSSRRVINNDEVVELLVSRGYVEIIAEHHPFHMQAGLFHRSDDVIGIMGASMTNTIFCPTGTNVTYLAPKGWLEPFYWDLAGASGHHYSAIYGEVESSETSYQDRFRIDLTELSSVIDKNERRHRNTSA